MRWCAPLLAAAGATAQRDVWAHWKAEYRPAGYDSTEEEAARYGCFQRALEEIERLNKEEPLARYEVNARADLCPEVQHTAVVRTNATRASSVDLPPANASVDWREKGAVLKDVHDQGSCGSCWAFGSSANMEAVWYIATGQLVDLSEQELVSCARNADSSGYPKGCSGGSGATHSYQWVIDNGGLDTTADYGRYTAQDGKCDKSKLKNIAAGPFSSFKVLPKDEVQMAQWLSWKGPLSIHIDASGWNSYRSGIMTKKPSTNLDHVVLIVGYGSDQGKDYWIIRNSWGPSWGEKGYVRLARGVDASGVSEEPATIQV